MEAIVSCAAFGERRRSSERRRVPHRGGAVRTTPPVAALIGLCLFAACRPAAPPAPLDTPTSGAITIAVDESFRPLMEAEIAVFTGLYRRASIDAVFKPEDEAIEDLVEGRVRLAVVSRALRPAEGAEFARQKIMPRTLKIAEDGVALILNRANPDSFVTMGALRGVLEGRIKTWADLNPSNAAGPVRIVFDGNRSSNLNYLLSTFGMANLDHVEAYAAASNREVIEYVHEHENAIGVVGASWISDVDDPSQQRFMAAVRVAAVSDAPEPADADFYQPYQAYLSLKTYPLRRDVIIISREARAGLGTGLISHIASDRGQRIVLKSGLLPATMPVRLVGIKETL